jgi:nucleoside 2-deoxyribosyltransferase
LETRSSTEATLPKRFYLAARKDRSAQADAMSDALTAQGWERTFAWTSQDIGGHEGLSAMAVAEMNGVREADVLIVLLPGGYGTHVEIGAALALGKPVILHAPDNKTLETPYPCVFHYHPGVKILVSPLPDISSIIDSASQSTEDSKA